MINTSRREELTEPQKAVYGFISEYLRDNKYPPTIREIQANFGFKSMSSSVGYIDVLKKKGYLTVGKNKHGARTMQIVDSIMGYHIVTTVELSKALAMLKAKGYQIGAQEAVEFLSILNIKIE